MFRIETGLAVAIGIGVGFAIGRGAALVWI